MLWKSSAPMVPRCREAPMTATLRGWKKTRRELATATTSRSAALRSASAVSLMGEAAPLVAALHSEGDPRRAAAAVQAAVHAVGDDALGGRLAQRGDEREAVLVVDAGEAAGGLLARVRGRAGEAA